jgi:hypothetical protein
MPARSFVSSSEVVVRADPDLLAWLDEFLSPGFESREPSRGPVLSIVTDARRFESLASSDRIGGSVVCHTFDERERPLPLVSGGEGPPHAIDRELGMAVRVFDSNGGSRPSRVEVVASRDRPDARLAALRTLRELDTAAALGAGAIPLHAAAVEDEGAVSLMVGPRRSGKSTLMLDALARGGSRYVSNDRAFAWVDAGVTTARAVATIVHLREGSSGLVPGTSGLFEAIDSGAWHYASTLSECRANRVAGRAAEGSGYRKPPGIGPAQLCSLLDVQASAGGRIARIVLPRVDPGSRGFRLAQLTPDAAAGQILQRGLVAGGTSASFLAAQPPVAREEMVERVTRLTRRVPCFTCSLGSGAYGPGAAGTPSVWSAIRGCEAAT